jgi:hypothetical protein
MTKLNWAPWEDRPLDAPPLDVDDKADWHRVFEAIDDGVAFQKEDTPDNRRRNRKRLDTWISERKRRWHKFTANHGIDDRRLAGYVRNTLNSIVNDDLARTPKGERNHALNAKAYQLGAFVNHNLLGRGDVIEALLDAARANGVWTEDGDDQCRASINSGLNAAAEHGLVPKLPEYLSEAAAGDDPGDVTESGKPDGQPVLADRLLKLKPMTGIDTCVPEWVWEYDDAGRIQLGALTLFAGKPAVGKSTGLRYFAARLTRGELPGCWHGQPVNVAVLMLEEQDDSIVVPGLIAADADISRLFTPRIVIGGRESKGLLAIADEQRLTEQLLEMNVRALLVDPIMSTFGANVDIYRNNEVRAYLEPYTNIAQAINGIVIGNTHLRKGEISDVLGDINGSGAFGEVPRGVWGFAPLDETQFVMQQVKNSAGPNDLALTYELPLTDVACDDGNTAFLPRFEITGKSDTLITDITRGEDDEGGLSAQSAAKEWLKFYLLENQPAPSNQVKADAKESGISQRTLERAAKKLKVAVVNVSQPSKPRMTAWVLPNG